MATITARLTADALDEVREAQSIGSASLADAIDEIIRLCLPSAIVNVDAQATAVTIAVKDDDLLRSLISLGIDEYVQCHAKQDDSVLAEARPAAMANHGGFKELIGAALAPLVAKPA